MSDNRSVSRGAGRPTQDYSSDDDPPMSRLFIICNKSHTEEDFREAFSKFGDIEDIWVVKDKQSHENKGIAYVKFSKTSDAAKAQEEMNGRTIGRTDRMLKVLVAANRNQGSNKSENEHEKYVRLFIVIPKTATDDEIRKEFSQWGDVESVTIVRDKSSGNPKGFGYVRFTKFYYAAVAFENCPSKYKAVFAEPKSSSRPREPYGRPTEEAQSFGSSRNSSFNNGNFPVSNSNDWPAAPVGNDMSNFLRMQNAPVTQPTCLEIIASNQANQDQLWRLFDIIPGLDYCQIMREHSSRTNEGVAVYNNPEAAIYAREKLHGLEYPVGERLIVKMSGMSNAGMSNSRMDASFLDKRAKRESICNVNLPPAQPLAPPEAPVAQRLFIVLAANLPHSILKNVFSCWKGLIDVYLLPNKNCGYVKYADRESAQKAISSLNGAEICGTKIKVMEAEERDGDESSRKRLRRN